MKVCANLKRIENLTYQFSDDQADMLKNLVQDLFNHFYSLLLWKDGLYSVKAKGESECCYYAKKNLKSLVNLSLIKNIKR